MDAFNKLIIKRGYKKYFWNISDHWDHSNLGGESDSVEGLMVQFEFIQIQFPSSVVQDLYQLEVGYEYVLESQRRST